MLSFVDRMAHEIPSEVHMYGLMAEHSNDDIVVWNGEHGDFVAVIGEQNLRHLKWDMTIMDTENSNHVQSERCALIFAMPKDGDII